MTSSWLHSGQETKWSEEGGGGWVVQSRVLLNNVINVGYV